MSKFFFKKCVPFQFDFEGAVSQEAWEKKIQQRRYREVPPGQLSSVGFVPVFSDYSETPPMMTHEFGGYLFLRLRIGKKKLPQRALNRAIDKRKAEAIRKAAEAGEELSRDQLNGIKDAVTDEYRRKTPAEEKDIFAAIDIERQWLWVDASKKEAELFHDRITSAITPPKQTTEGEGKRDADVEKNEPTEPLGFRPFFDSPITDYLTTWLAMAEERPAEIHLGQSASMTDGQGGGKVSLSKQDLDSQEVLGHVHAGKLVANLGLTFSDKLRFVINEHGHLSSLCPDGLVLADIGKQVDEAEEGLKNAAPEASSDSERDNSREELMKLTAEANWLLMCGSLRDLYDWLRSTALVSSNADNESAGHKSDSVEAA